MKSARTIDVSLATSAAPVAGVLGAFLILGERPMSAQLIGGAVLVLGIAVGLRGALAKEEYSPGQLPDAASALKAELKTGFKGV